MNISDSDSVEENQDFKVEGQVPKEVAPDFMDYQLSPLDKDMSPVEYTSQAKFLLAASLIGGFTGVGVSAFKSYIEDIKEFFYG